MKSCIVIPVTHFIFPILLAMASVSQIKAEIILLGSASGVDTVAGVNSIINQYNTDFAQSLPLVGAMLDKLEGQSTANFTVGNLSLINFNFYQQSDGGLVDINIFDELPEEFVSWNPAVLGFDDIDNPVVAFQQLSGPSFDYYVSKSGTGFSVWATRAGVINPVYRDIAGTRGSINNSSLAYAPPSNGGAVSHISFYTAVPEPSSAVLAMLSFSALSILRRRPVQGSHRS